MTDEERNELLRLADHVDVLIKFCAAHMPSNRVEQYRAGSSAFWAIVHKIAGNETEFERLRGDVPDVVVRPPTEPAY